MMETFVRNWWLAVQTLLAVVALVAGLAAQQWLVVVIALVAGTIGGRMLWTRRHHG